MKRKILCGKCGTTFIYSISYKQEKDGTIRRNAFIECPNCLKYVDDFEILEKK